LVELGIFLKAFGNKRIKKNLIPGEKIGERENKKAYYRVVIGFLLCLEIKLFL